MLAGHDASAIILFFKNQSGGKTTICYQRWPSIFSNVLVMTVHFEFGGWRDKSWWTNQQWERRTSTSPRHDLSIDGSDWLDSLDSSSHQANFHARFLNALQRHELCRSYLLDVTCYYRYGTRYVGRIGVVS
jgi:hypothetical protein